MGAELGECLTTSCGDRGYGAPAHALNTRSCVLELQPKVLHNAPLKSNESLKLKINEVQSIGTIGKYTAPQRKNVYNCTANTHIYKHIYKYIFKHISKKIPAFLLIPHPLSCCTPCSAWPDEGSEVMCRDIELCRARGFLWLQGPGARGKRTSVPEPLRVTRSQPEPIWTVTPGAISFFFRFLPAKPALATRNQTESIRKVFFPFFHEIRAQSFSWRVL